MTERGGTGAAEAAVQGAAWFPVLEQLVAVGPRLRPEVGAVRVEEAKNQRRRAIGQ